MMPSAAAMTATETPASAGMCRKAPRMLRSDLLPRLKSQAETPLTTTASAATAITVVAGDRLRLGEAAERFPGDGAGRDQQDHPVGEGGQDRGRVHAEGEAVARLPVGDGDGAPGHHQTHHVAEVVTGVGEQRQRIGGEAVPDLADHQREIERDGNAEGPAEMVRRVVVMVMRRRVAVVVRHGFEVLFEREPNAAGDEY